MRSDTITMERELAEAEAEIAALRDKAAAFDTLSERLASGDWRVERWEPAPYVRGVRLTVARTGERIICATLAEAVRLAMEAEGER